mmetsp:Transcript_26829/g.48355  ORF Transcript_26829/g.48355 Transcript_26829/m.48355 type:complete len:148 (-) Transcript_26829:31-474(-)
MSDIIDIDNTKSITLEAGTTAELELSTNRSARLNWSLDSISDPSVQLVGSKLGVYVQPDSHVYGAEGKQIFTVTTSADSLNGTEANCVFRQRDSDNGVEDIHYLSIDIESARSSSSTSTLSRIALTESTDALSESTEVQSEPAEAPQ